MRVCVLLTCLIGALYGTDCKCMDVCGCEFSYLCRNNGCGGEHNKCSSCGNFSCSKMIRAKVRVDKGNASLDCQGKKCPAKDDHQMCDGCKGMQCPMNGMISAPMANGKCGVVLSPVYMDGLFFEVGLLVERVDFDGLEICQMVPRMTPEVKNLVNDADNYRPGVSFSDNPDPSFPDGVMGTSSVVHADPGAHVGLAGGVGYVFDDGWSVRAHVRWLTTSVNVVEESEVNSANFMSHIGKVKNVVLPINNIFSGSYRLNLVPRIIRRDVNSSVTEESTGGDDVAVDTAGESVARMINPPDIPIDGPEWFPTPRVTPVCFDDVKANITLDHYSMDISLSRAAYVSRGFSIEPHFGIESVWNLYKRELIFSGGLRRIRVGTIIFADTDHPDRNAAMDPSKSRLPTPAQKMYHEAKLLPVPQDIIEPYPGGDSEECNEIIYQGFVRGHHYIYDQNAYFWGCGTMVGMNCTFKLVDCIDIFSDTSLSMLVGENSADVNAQIGIGRNNPYNRDLVASTEITLPSSEDTTNMSLGSANTFVTQNEFSSSVDKLFTISPAVRIIAGFRCEIPVNQNCQKIVGKIAVSTQHYWNQLHTLDAAYRSDHIRQDGDSVNVPFTLDLEEHNVISIFGLYLHFRWSV